MELGGAAMEVRRGALPRVTLQNLTLIDGSRGLETTTVSRHDGLPAAGGATWLVVACLVPAAVWLLLSLPGRAAAAAAAGSSGRA